MLTRRHLLEIAPAAALAAASLPAFGDGFIPLTNDGEIMTCAMPPGETLVEVKLTDGSIVRSMYDHNIMEAGDWDFMTLDAHDEAGDESLSDKVVAWRKIG